MKPEEIKMVGDFEDALEVGCRVRVCWTNSGRTFVARGLVGKINAKSIRVTLSERVYIGLERLGDDGTLAYEAGRSIIVPRLDDIRRWSCRNRVEPWGGYAEVP